VETLRLGIIMNGVTGRMGTNQHLVRSINAIRAQGGVTLADGRRVIDQGWVQANLAKVKAGLEVLRLTNWKQAWALTHSHLNYADASVVKVFGSEFYVTAYKLLLEVLGPAGGIRDGSPDVVLRGRCERLYRGHAPILTFGGGTNEVQRDIIAMIGLGMPRAPR